MTKDKLPSAEDVKGILKGYEHDLEAIEEAARTVIKADDNRIKIKGESGE